MRNLRYILPGITALAFVYALLTVLWPVPDPVPAESWKAVEKLMNPHRPSGDLVIVHPSWEDGALLHFKKNFLILGRPNTDSYTVYPRIWVVLAHGAPEPGYLDGFHLDFREKVGDLEVLRYVHPDAKHVLFDFFTHIEDGRVTSVRDDDVKECNEFNLMRWWCPTKEWNHVGQRSVSIQKTWQSGIWMHPLSSRITRLEYKNVPMGKRLAGEYALSDKAADLKNIPPVVFRVLINGETVAIYESEAVPGWHAFEIDTRRWENHKATVTFEGTSKKDNMRHFCFLAQTRTDELGIPRVPKRNALPAIEVDPEREETKKRDEKQKRQKDTDDPDKDKDGDDRKNQWKRNLERRLKDHKTRREANKARREKQRESRKKSKPKASPTPSGGRGNKKGGKP